MEELAKEKEQSKTQDIAKEYLEIFKQSSLTILEELYIV